MRKTVRNYLRRVLEIIWKGGECLGHGNIIYWVLYLDGFWWAGPSSSQPELPGSKKRDLSSEALHVSLHLPSWVPTRIKQGWWTDCSYQIGVWPRSVLQYSTKVETPCTPCSSLPTALMRLTAGFSLLSWEGTHPDKTCWLQAAECCVPHGCESMLE